MFASLSNITPEITDSHPFPPYLGRSRSTSPGTGLSMIGVPAGRLLTTAELAAELRVNVKTVREWARTGRITAAAVTPGGQYRFRLDDVLEELKQPRPRPDPG
jgi:excisionase family DNA binding protein